MEYLGLPVVGETDVGEAHAIPMYHNGFGGLGELGELEKGLCIGNDIRHEVHLVETRPQIGDGYHDRHREDTCKCKLRHSKGPSQIKRDTHRHHT